MKRLLVSLLLTRRSRSETDFPNCARASPHFRTRQAFVIGSRSFNRREYLVYNIRLTMMSIFVKEFSKVIQILAERLILHVHCKIVVDSCCKQAITLTTPVRGVVGVMAMLRQLPNVLHAGSLPDGQFAFNTSWIQAPSVGTAA